MAASRKRGARGRALTAAGTPPMDKVELCPAQRQAVDRLLKLWPSSDVFVLWTRSGLGRSTMLRALRQQLGGSPILAASDWFMPLGEEHPLRIEETFVREATARLEPGKALLVDDYDRLACVAGGCNHWYPRSGMDQPALLALLDSARRTGCKVVVATTGSVNEVVDPRCLFVGFNRLDIEDYRFLFGHYLADRATSIDVQRVFEFAPRLTIHQIRGSLDVLRDHDALTTDVVIDYLERLKMASNVNVGQVRPVTLADLKGVDEVVAALGRFVINPLVEEELARKYAVRPKRGILLYGPPGTGKTTVGRALALRLRSKFFRIDGTFISRTSDFYQRIFRVFEGAKENAPSLVFIDDCDTIFEDKDEFGLYRYLLTTLDGLESEDMAGVSVMMTAMNVASLPPALIRSGRIELWLEMKPPNASARQDILAACLAKFPGGTDSLDLAAVAAATEGFTGADLNRLVEDAKALLIAELAVGQSVGELTPFFLRAAEEVRRNMQLVSEAVRAAEARATPRTRDPYGRSGGGFDEDDSPPSA
jgi:transitional endoplasmic reticulum ATPase